MATATGQYFQTIFCVFNTDTVYKFSGLLYEPPSKGVSIVIDNVPYHLSTDVTDSFRSDGVLIRTYIVYQL